MAKETIKTNYVFVDKNFKILPIEQVERRFAIYCGKTKYYIKNKEVEVCEYVSAQPLFQNVNMQEAVAKCNHIVKRNASCVYAKLLSVPEIKLLNFWGRTLAKKFRIKNTRTSTADFNWKGDIFGYHYWLSKDEIDDGENKTGAYIRFCLVANEPQEINL
ncbi:MAG: hypothetical protein E7012_05190 [Alphaproteobacteria bacterium]|nr:hypothetical protein [Alphaproteobacteria bacterium]